MSSGRLQEVKQWEMINHQANKVVAVSCDRWLFMRGIYRRDLTGKILVFWIGGCF